MFRNVFGGPIANIIQNKSINVVLPSDKTSINVPACFHVSADLNCLGYWINYRNPTIHITPEFIKWGKTDIAIMHEIGHWFQYESGLWKNHIPTFHKDEWFGTLEELFYTDKLIPQDEINSIMRMFIFKWNYCPEQLDIPEILKDPWYSMPCEIHAVLFSLMALYPNETKEIAPILSELLLNSPIWKSYVNGIK